MIDLVAVESSLDIAFTMVEEIRGQLNEGELMDTTELGNLVQAACLGAVKLDQDDAPKVRLRLAELLDALQAVKAEMVALEESAAGAESAAVGG